MCLPLEPRRQTRQPAPMLAAAPGSVPAPARADAPAVASVFELEWGRPLPQEALQLLARARHSAQPLVVIGSDLLVTEGVVRPLVQTLTLLDAPHTVLALADRGDAHTRFVRVAERCFDVRSLRRQHNASGRGDVEVFLLQRLQRGNSSSEARAGRQQQVLASSETEDSAEHGGRGRIRDMRRALATELCLEPWWLW